MVLLYRDHDFTEPLLTPSAHHISYMPRSELEDESQQVQGFLNMLVETGALKMYDTRTGLHERDRNVDEDVRVEDGILTR